MDWIMERDRVQVLDGQWNVLAEVTFPVVEPGIVEINHTFVDESLRGQGVAGQLMGRAVASIAASGYYARPTCSYAVSWFEKHPEHAGLLAYPRPSAPSGSQRRRRNRLSPHVRAGTLHAATMTAERPRTMRVPQSGSRRTGCS